jgi:hypothetical protein
MLSVSDGVIILTPAPLRLFFTSFTARSLPGMERAEKMTVSPRPSRKRPDARRAQAVAKRRAELALRTGDDHHKLRSASSILNLILARGNAVHRVSIAAASIAASIILCSERPTTADPPPAFLRGAGDADDTPDIRGENRDRHAALAAAELGLEAHLHIALGTRPARALPRSWNRQHRRRMPFCAGYP